MARILLVTQGGLAEELVRSAGKIAGSSDAIEPISLDWDESPAESEGKIGRALAHAGANEDLDGVLILTDLPGATPFNVAKSFARPGRVEVLSGVNLSMIVRLCCPGCAGLPVGELALWLREKGRLSICHHDAGASSESGQNGG